MRKNYNSLDEKIRDIDFTNPAINRLVHYSNILLEQIQYLKDNGVKDFSLINDTNKIHGITPFDKEPFL